MRKLIKYGLGCMTIKEIHRRVKNYAQEELSAIRSQDPVFLLIILERKMDQI